MAFLKPMTESRNHKGHEGTRNTQNIGLVPSFVPAAVMDFEPAMNEKRPRDFKITFTPFYDMIVGGRNLLESSA
jgi:hypothetical protein